MSLIGARLRSLEIEARCQIAALLEIEVSMISLELFEDKVNPEYLYTSLHVKVLLTEDQWNALWRWISDYGGEHVRPLDA